MSSLIEQAALRLQQLRQTGVEMAQNAPDLKPAPAHVETEQPKVQAQAAPAPSPSRRVEIDLVAMSGAGIVTPNAPRSQIADQFRVIKRPLIANALGKGASAIASGNLIMVTSALPGEGKTFSAINLAMSIATELDCTVMLVDADVARPSVMNVLGLPASPGLLDLVAADSTDVAPFLLKTNIDKLTILPSGTQHDRATELLASDAMTRLLDDMAQRYPDRIIVFDSPPLLLTTEARVLASHMGQVVIVVRAEQTLQSDVTQALSLIETCPVKLLLLNQARGAVTEGYGYGAGYGS